MLEAPDLGNEDADMPKDPSSGKKPTSRRYSPEEKASAVRMVRTLRAIATAQTLAAGQAVAIAAHSHDVLRPDVTAVPSENVEPSHVVCDPGAVAGDVRPRRVAPRHH
jgi:hypothetical protein